MPNFNRRSLISFLPIPLIGGLGNTLMARSLTANSSTLSMIVYKTPNCGCCVKWVVHLEELGFSVETINVTDTGPIARRYGVPSSLRSCHTAITDGYAIEGHVPAKDIIRLIEEKPTVAGLAVPGMPVGSPGMEFGDRRDPYQVLAFDSNGESRIFASY